MTKRTPLEEVFDLPAMRDLEDQIDNHDDEEYTTEEMYAIMERADKIDAALPQVSGLDGVDADYDEYARKAITTFDDLVDLGKSVEDRFAADIYNAASNMLSNALNAKTNKAQKKLEMVKLQIQKAKLEHEQDKLEYLKQRHLKNNNDDTQETQGEIIATRNDMLNEILAGMKKGKDS